MSTHFSPAGYLDSAVRDVLTGDESQVDATVARVGVLLGACGAGGECDRLVLRWRAATTRPVSDLATEPVRERAWAVLLTCRTPPPEWARELTPRDPQQVEREQADYLRRGEPALPQGLAEAGSAGRMVSTIAELLAGESGPDALRALAAQAEEHASRGAISAATAAVEQWAQRAVRTSRPDVAMLAACRHLAPLLSDGMLARALAIPGEWPRQCSGELTAALHTRFSAGTGEYGWSELIQRIMWLREGEERSETTPRPAAPSGLEAAERRLGTRLPDDYRRFLLTCDGLPADVVFPRLLSAAELVRTDAGIPVSATNTRFGESSTIMLVRRGGQWRPVEWDSTLATTEHAGFRELLQHHLRLLEDS